MPGLFKYEDCPLKHFIRRDVWLPKCRDRQRALLKNRPPRRLKYFTFCAVGALDVLLLDRERVLRRSKDDEFDTVFFFDKDEEMVTETRRRIPGANGFPGDFVKIMLDTPDEADLATEYLETEDDTIEVRKSQRYRDQRRQFFTSFPFDVINLDVEEFLYPESEKLPGRLTAAIRKLLIMQRNEGANRGGERYSVNEFTLLFTTQVGPPGITNEHLEYLLGCIENNLQTFSELETPFLARSNGRDAHAFFEQDFDEAFKLAVPKSLSELAWEEDWYIDGERGIEVFQFQRESRDGPYCMLHMAMTVRRQDPPKEKRGPGQARPVAEAEHRKVVNRIFTELVISVEERVTALGNEIPEDLLHLFEHRTHYYP